MSGIAGGADVILIPELPVDRREVCARDRAAATRAARTSRSWSSARATSCPGAEDKGEVDQFGHSCSPSAASASGSRARSRSRTGFETRVTVLGHVQRGGSPTAHDRVLATRFGLKAADLVEEGEFGQMAALRGDDIVAVPLEEARPS